MKPDFDTMSTAELRAYLLAHRDDDETFYQLADRLEANGNDTVLYPAPNSPETIALMETAIREHIQKLDEQHQQQG
ncbi:MAG: hypothetical protein MUF49_08015 [Oculatellaceae cyanobacterium Prado106]|jgi:hypothetical protein|nr:hypothetical protein [Oculatellaceae cyanobacterium Prado106]